MGTKDTAVAVVDENGVVTATGVGKTTVIAKAGDKTAECTVTVYEVKAGHSQRFLLAKLKK